jgi:hypothetical protein
MSALILDLETISRPKEEILASMPEWSEEEARTRVPKNYKAEATISGWLEADRVEWGNSVLEKAALTPEHANIAIVGIYTPGQVTEVEQWVLGEEGVTEKQMLYGVLDVLRMTLRRGDYILGWNVGFDIKMLVRRSWILGIPVPPELFNPLSRYPVSVEVVDMMTKFSAGDFKVPYTSLDNAFKAMSLPGKMDGGEFGKLWLEDRQKAIKYNEEELLGQASLYRRMGVKL